MRAVFAVQKGDKVMALYINQEQAVDHCRRVPGLRWVVLQITPPAPINYTGQE